MPPVAAAVGYDKGAGTPWYDLGVTID